MKNLDKKQNSEGQNLNKGEKSMNEKNLNRPNTKENEQQTKKESTAMNKVKTSDRKLGTAYQQNLIEMFSYIYYYPNYHTYYSLAKEMSKSKRTIQRMIEDINTFCPNLIATKTDFMGRVKLREVSYGISEEYLDACYNKTNNAPLLYIYLVMMLNRPVTLQDIMRKLGIKESDAKKIAKKLLDTTASIDVAEDDSEEIIFGNYHFVKKYI